MFVLSNLQIVEKFEITFGRHEPADGVKGVRQRRHEILEALFVLAQIDHQKTTESGVKSRPTSHILNERTTL